MSDLNPRVLRGQLGPWVGKKVMIGTTDLHYVSGGATDVLTAHAEVLRHATRASALSSRVTRAGLDGPAVLLRDALDLGLLGEDEFRKLAGRPSSEVPPPPSLDEEVAHDDAPELPE